VIKFDDGVKFGFWVDLELDTILELKQKIRARLGIPIEIQRLSNE